MAFNGYFYSLFIRDIKIYYKDYQFKNNSRYFILYGKYVNAIFFKRRRDKIFVMFTTEDKILHRKVYKSDFYKRVLKDFNKDFERWNT